MKTEVKFDVHEVSLKAKMDKEGNLATQVVLETSLSPIAVARLLNLQRQRVPLEAIVGTNQLAFDLSMVEQGQEAKPRPELQWPELQLPVKG